MVRARKLKLSQIVHPNKTTNNLGKKGKQICISSKILVLLPRFDGDCQEEVNIPFRYHILSEHEIFVKNCKNQVVIIKGQSYHGLLPTTLPKLEFPRLLVLILRQCFNYLLWKTGLKSFCFSVHCKNAVTPRREDVREVVTYLSWQEQEVKNVKKKHLHHSVSLFLPCLQARPFTSPVILYEILSLLHHCTAQ